MRFGAKGNCVCSSEIGLGSKGIVMEGVLGSARGCSEVSKQRGGGAQGV